MDDVEDDFGLDLDIEEEMDAERDALTVPEEEPMVSKQTMFPIFFFIFVYILLIVSFLTKIFFRSQKKSSTVKQSGAGLHLIQSILKKSPSFSSNSILTTIWVIFMFTIMFMSNSFYILLYYIFISCKIFKNNYFTR